MREPRFLTERTGKVLVSVWVNLCERTESKEAGLNCRLNVLIWSELSTNIALEPPENTDMASTLIIY
jgi:hypothetical protein